jgi:peptidoglycan/LPS O-acetylase OafA/YrhL
LVEGAREHRGFGYQPALDGLRAIAVFGVLVYHAFGETATLGRGGFLGVDIFFVLSGYLITSLLLAEHERSGRIALPSFWARRARRLLPAVALTMVLVAVYAVTLAPESTREAIRPNVFATLFYVQNWHLCGAVGVWGNPLSHTWSLSIEEQWYVVWPVVALLAVRWARGRHLALGALCGVAAVASASWMIYVHESAGFRRAYYGTDTRVQALLIGAALAFFLRAVDVERRVPARVLQPIGVVAGLFLVAALANAKITATYMFRGGYFLVAIATAVVITAAVQPTGPLRRVLSIRVLVAAGLISYGIYLFHLPLYSFLTSAHTGLHGVPLFAVRVGATVALATASYFVLEQPVRTGKLSTTRAWIALPTAFVAIVAMTLLATRPPAPAPPRPALAATTVRAYEQLAADAADETRILVVGGTQAALMNTGITGQYLEPGVAGTTIGFFGCGVASGRIVLTDGELPDAGRCKRRLDGARAAVAAYEPDVIALMTDSQDLFDRRSAGQEIVVGTKAWADYMTGQLDALRAGLGAPDARFVLVTTPCARPTAESQFASVLDDPERLAALNEFWRDYAAAHDDVELAELDRLLCPDGRRVDQLDGVPVTNDAGALTAEGTRSLWHWLANQTTAASA